MSAVRLRRLTADHAQIQEYTRRHARVRLIQAAGDPPERYQLEYRVRSLRMNGGELGEADTHLVEIHLPLNYPRTPPQCRMLSPVFHPNIAPHAICVGDHWSAGESLQSLVMRIGEMLAYQSYNTKSPLNGEAARWVDQNKHRLPLDPVSMLVEEQTPAASPTPAVAAAAMAPPPPAAAPGPPAGAAPQGETAAAGIPGESAEPVAVKCPKCDARYNLDPRLRGRRVRCKSCEGLIVVPAA
ncbi:Ubiquitin-conjugating enzyme [Pseudobythopirellula maris]|uniref:Ubiquitin-conjugating enzyme n=1 Tax=Pseudobythopirellula maris TaxID=2527991 RepID=A0A5C5ZK06_9BACT|nr:ubiquitin-conjugating enzyme E2 [Pseudobythopirellula maris]TWT87161.1 Ubiquitin-conjugating enzyme [Pseudobythopirellula maris]